MKSLDNIAFVFNTVAMGDVIAAVPAIKHMAKTYPDLNYIVVVKKHFMPLFPFVPEFRFRDFDVKENMWGIPSNFALSLINQQKNGRITRVTPKSIHLTDCGSLLLTGRLLTGRARDYVPLKDVNVDHFSIDFSNCAIIVATFRDEARKIEANVMYDICKYLQSKGVTPVIIGKTEDLNEATRDDIKPKTDILSEEGIIDLRNKTSISELATIIGKSKMIIGADSGPIHLAGTTSTPIICVYTSVSPEHREPSRPNGSFHPITANIDCIGCESKWHSSFWNFEKCFTETRDCVKMISLQDFIDPINSILGD